MAARAITARASCRIVACTAVFPSERRATRSFIFRIPKGYDEETQRASLDTLNQLNAGAFTRQGDPDISARIHSYEMAYRLRSSAPELIDLSREPKHVLDLYGITDIKKPGYARNCLLARRLIERGVRFVQLFHEAWDHHGGLTSGVKQSAQDTDKASAALVIDLKERGLLDDTLLVGAVNLAVHRWFRAVTTDGITTTVASPSGSPEAASAKATCTAKRTTLASTSSVTRSM